MRKKKKKSELVIYMRGSNDSQPDRVHIDLEEKEIKKDSCITDVNNYGEDSSPTMRKLSERKMWRLFEFSFNQV